MQYLLGNLTAQYLTELRAFGGLQAYPSRTKDPDPVDFSTGSVGLGAVAPAVRRAGRPLRRAPLRRRSTLRALHRADRRRRAGRGQRLGGGRRGPRGTRLGNVLWIVDLNRQSLDRVIPGIRVRAAGGAVPRQRLAGAGGEVRPPAAGRLRPAGRRGAAPAHRRHAQRGVPGADPAAGRGAARAADRRRAGDRATRVARCHRRRRRRRAARRCWPTWAATTWRSCCRAFAAADADTARRRSLFAYTIKGWGLPFAGDPLNHSALLTDEQIDDAARASSAWPPGDEWDALPAETRRRAGSVASAAASACAARRALAAAALGRPPTSRTTLGCAACRPAPRRRRSSGDSLAELARVAGRSASGIVTASPGRVGLDQPGRLDQPRRRLRRPWQAPTTRPTAPRLLRWEPGPRGQHIELGISRDEPVHAARPARPGARAVRRAAAARSARSTTRSSAAGSTR